MKDTDVVADASSRRLQLYWGISQKQTYWSHKQKKSTQDKFQRGAILGKKRKQQQAKKKTVLYSLILHDRKGYFYFIFLLRRLCIFQGQISHSAHRGTVGQFKAFCQGQAAARPHLYAGGGRWQKGFLSEGKMQAGVCFTNARAMAAIWRYGSSKTLIMRDTKKNRQNISASWIVTDNKRDCQLPLTCLLRNGPQLRMKHLVLSASVLLGSLNPSHVYAEDTQLAWCCQCTFNAVIVVWTLSIGFHLGLGRS